MEATLLVLLVERCRRVFLQEKFGIKALLSSFVEVGSDVIFTGIAPSHCLFTVLFTDILTALSFLTVLLLTFSLSFSNGIFTVLSNVFSNGISTVLFLLSSH